MKKYMVLFLVFASQQVFSETYNCTFTHENEREELQLKVYQTIASTSLGFTGKEYNYRDCKTQKDQFGTLIDCNSGLTDFMILIDEKGQQTSGGIMSSTHDLFVDLNCSA